MFGVVDELQAKIEVLEAEKKNNICKNCVHWSEAAKRIEGIRACKKVKMLWDCTQWIEDDEDDCKRVLNENHKNDRAFVQDGSDYMANLYTKFDFGCNQFEKIVE